MTLNKFNSKLNILLLMLAVFLLAAKSMAKSYDVYHLPRGACVSDLWKNNNTSKNGYIEFNENMVEHYESYHWGRQENYAECIVKYEVLLANQSKREDFIKAHDDFGTENVSQALLTTIIFSPLGFIMNVGGINYLVAKAEYYTDEYWDCRKGFNALEEKLCVEEIHGIDGVIHENETVLEL